MPGGVKSQAYRLVAFSKLDPPTLSPARKGEGIRECNASR